MPQYHHITIRFLRASAGGVRTDPNTDDILEIQKLGENSVRCIYTERSFDGTLIDNSVFTYNHMMAYLYRIFYLLGLDEDPFASVQFFIPGYPTILIQVATLRQNLYALMEIVMSTCLAWPTTQD
jgi:hypothetical protein